MADHVAVIRRGRICQRDTPQGMYANPADAELARFVGEANLIAGVFAPTWVRTAFGNLMLHGASNGGGASPHAPDTPAVVLIRPEQVRLQPPGCGRARPSRAGARLPLPRPRGDDPGGAGRLVTMISSCSPGRPGRIEFPPGKLGLDRDPGSGRRVAGRRERRPRLARPAEQLDVVGLGSPGERPGQPVLVERRLGHALDSRRVGRVTPRVGVVGETADLDRVLRATGSPRSRSGGGRAPCRAC